MTTKKEIIRTLSTRQLRDPDLIKFIDPSTFGLTNLGVRTFGSGPEVRDAIKLEEPGLRVTRTTVNAAFKILKASSLEARITKVGNLNQAEYKTCKATGGHLIDWENGGLLPEVITKLEARIDTQGLQRLKQQDTLHKGYIENVKEIIEAIKTGTLKNPNLQQYVNQNKKELTNFVQKIFGGDTKIHAALSQAHCSDKAAMVLDHQLATQGKPANAIDRLKNMGKTTIVGTIIVALGWGLIDKALEMKVYEPIVTTATTTFNAGAAYLKTNWNQTDEELKTKAKNTTLQESLSPENIKARIAQETKLQQLTGAEKKVRTETVVDQTLAEFVNTKPSTLRILSIPPQSAVTMVPQKPQLKPKKLNSTTEMVLTY